MFKISANKLTLEKASEMLIMNFQIYLFFWKKKYPQGCILFNHPNDQPQR